jgi:glycerol-3-phosphate dehydrogenase (NAD(P)+)
MKIQVLGAGAWGTAQAILLGRNGHEVTLEAHTPEEVEMLSTYRENIRFLSGFRIPEEVEFCQVGTSEGSFDLSVVAVPSSAVRDIAGAVRSERVVVTSKGLEGGTGQVLTSVLQEHLSGSQVGALSGPNLAVEIVRGIPTAAVTAFEQEEDADAVRLAYKCRTFRVYLSNDVIGLQLAGALKNVVAIAAGISDGLGFGDNTKGALVARGLREMCLLGRAMNARQETFMGIAGVGDLFATAASPLSRNYAVGRGLGEGKTLKSLLESLGHVAEGVLTCEAACILAKAHAVEVPVMDAIRRVVEGTLKPSDGVSLLMERSTPSEGLVGT